MKNRQNNTSAPPALLRTPLSVDTLETDSLCCAAAGIIGPSGVTADVPTPHEKLRGAALDDATLNPQERPLAQPFVGYTQASYNIEFSPEEKTDRGNGAKDLTRRAE